MHQNSFSAVLPSDPAGDEGSLVCVETVAFLYSNHRLSQEFRLEAACTEAPEIEKPKVSRERVWEVVS